MTKIILDVEVQNYYYFYRGSRRAFFNSGTCIYNAYLNCLYSDYILLNIHKNFGRIKIYCIKSHRQNL